MALCSFIDDVDDDFERPGHSLLDLVHSNDFSRVVLSQYHAVGAPTGAFMVADSRCKYHYYVDYPAELFDLRFDPEETRNLATDTAYAQRMETMHAALLKELGGRTPEQVDRMAKDDQNEIVERFGGREKALYEGTPAATPVPGKGHE